jgi:hypothetical protein
LGQHDDGDNNEDQRVPGSVDGKIDSDLEGFTGLDDLVGDAAGKIVLEEGPALANDVPMALPAHDAHQIGHDGVVAYDSVEKECDGTHQHDDEDHPEEALAVLAEDVAGIGGGQEAHDHADENGHERIGDRPDSDEHHADDEDGAKLVDEVEREGTKAHGRLAVGGERYGRVEIVEIADDAVEHWELMS